MQVLVESHDERQGNGVGERVIAAEIVETADRQTDRVSKIETEGRGDRLTNRDRSFDVLTDVVGKRGVIDGSPETCDGFERAERPVRLVGRPADDHHVDEVLQQGSVGECFVGHASSFSDSGAKGPPSATARYLMVFRMSPSAAVRPIRTASYIGMPYRSETACVAAATERRA